MTDLLECPVFPIPVRKAISQLTYFKTQLMTELRLPAVLYDCGNASANELDGFLAG